MTADRLDLLDYRRRVSALYAQVRAGGTSDSTWSLWRSRRDGLFASTRNRRLMQRNSRPSAD